MESKFNKPKAYFIDIDGTLVSGHKDKKINLDDLHAMKNAAKRGTYIILSTGRSLPDLKKIWDQINDGTEFTRYGVINNGSGIYDMKKNKLLFEDYLDEETFRQIFEYAKQGGYAAKNSQEKIFFTNPGLLAWILRTFSKTNIVCHKFEQAKYNPESAKKIGMITRGTKKTVARIAKDIDDKFDKVDVVISGPGLYIEVNKKGISKGSAIEFLANHIGFDAKETVHIGDSLNDAAGFKAAGYGVAMGNAMKELKEQADFITYPRKKAGVANTIKSFGNI